MEINKVLENRKNNLNKHMKKFKDIKFKKNDVLVFDIEACAIKNHTEMLMLKDINMMINIHLLELIHNFK